jgi:pentatricopeptide repeat protein
MISVDRDENGAPDDYEDFLAELVDVDAYNVLLADFETEIRDYLDADVANTYTTLISTYNKAKRTDETWGRFKQFGFYLSTKDLGVLTYLTSVDTYEEELVSGFTAAYLEYQLPENLEKASLYYSELVAGSTGVYLLKCGKGTNFTKPSAKFEMTYDSNNVPKYTVGIENTEDKPSIEQLKIYAQKRFYEIVYGTASTVGTTYGITVPVIPTSVTDAIDAYFTSLHDSMYVVGFLNIIIADDLQTGEFINEYSSYCDLTDAQIKAIVTQVRQIYFDQVFSEWDTLD